MNQRTPDTKNLIKPKLVDLKKIKEFEITKTILALSTGMGCIALISFFWDAGITPSFNLGESVFLLTSIAAVGVIITASLAISFTMPAILSCIIGIFLPPKIDHELAENITPTMVLMLTMILVFLLLEGIDLETSWAIFTKYVMLLISVPLVIFHIINIIAFNSLASSLAIIISVPLAWSISPTIAWVYFSSTWIDSHYLLDDASSFIFYMIGWIVICNTMNYFAYIFLKSGGYLEFMTFGIIILIISTIFQSIPLTPIKTIVRTLGLGEAPVGLVVTEQGCNMINNATRGQKICELNNQTKQGWVCPVFLKSRIGTPFVIELTSFSLDERWPAISLTSQNSKQNNSHELIYSKITIPERDVLSWPAIKPFRKRIEKGLLQSCNSDTNNESCRARRRRVITYLDQNSEHLLQPQKRWLNEQCGPLPKDRL